MYNYENIRIVLIESNKNILEQVKNNLEDFGYKVLEVFRNGEKALEKIRTLEFIKQPELIITDMNLDGNINGIELTDIINREFNIPVIYIGSSEDYPVYQLTKTTRHYGFLEKPINKNELCSTVSMAISKYQTEIKLKNSREWMITILKSIEVGIITLDIKGRITFINTTGEKLTGWKDEEAVGQDIHNVLNIKDGNVKQKNHNIPIERILKEKTYLKIAENIELQSKNNNINIINESGAPIKNSENEIIGIVIILHDITRQMESQKALQESERLHRITLNNISDAVFITDDNGKFTYICPNAEVIFGYTEEEIGNFAYINKILDDSIYDKETLYETGEITNLKLKIKNKQGRIKNLLVNVKRVSIGEGSILYTCHDVSELKKAEDRISRLNRMYSLLSEINETIVRIKVYDKLFDEVCRIAVEKGLFKIAWIGFTDSKKSKVVPVSHHGSDSDYILNMHF
ncbi:MAG: PAS domain S-box protein, partial [Spirochaetota bacterium]